MKVSQTVHICRCFLTPFIAIMAGVFIINFSYSSNLNSQNLDQVAAKQLDDDAQVSDNVATSDVENISTEETECEEFKIEDYSYEFSNFTVDFDYYDSSDTAKVDVYLKNTGIATWYGENTLCEQKLQLGTQRVQDRASVFWSWDKDSNWIRDDYKNRIIFTADQVLPGEIADFEFQITVPEDSGVYREFFAPLIPGFAWFDNDFYIDFEIGEFDENDKEKISTANITTSSTSFGEDKNIEVDLTNQMMYLRYGDGRFYALQVSSGKSKTPTPESQWTIHNKQELRITGKSPYYRMPFWLGLTRPKYGFQGFGLHGLPYLVNSKGAKYWDERNEPGMHLGLPVSHGCVRMAPSADEIVWNFGEIGMKVWTHK